MKTAYKSIMAVVLVSLLVSLAIVSVATPVSAQDAFILTVGYDKIFTTCNWHYEIIGWDGKYGCEKYSDWNEGEATSFALPNR